MEVIVKKIDGELVAEIPAEALKLMGVVEGETLVIDGNAHSVSLRRAELDSAIRDILDEDHDVLKKLARSERMDMVRDIMDEYDEALTELAK